MATGVGALTFDERHEMMRRRMLRCQPQADSNTALAHLYCGVKVSRFVVLALIFFSAQYFENFVKLQPNIFCFSLLKFVTFSALVKC